MSNPPGLCYPISCGNREQYWRTLNRYVSLALAAAATTTLKVGAGISLLAQRDPIWTAKQAATVDFLSGGRLHFGIGYGRDREEMESHDTAYLERRALLREKMLMIKTFWTQEEPSFNGELMTLEPSWAYPKPVQKPHPPIIMGAAAGPKRLLTWWSSTTGGCHWLRVMTLPVRSRP